MNGNCWWKMDAAIARRKDLSSTAKLLHAYLSDRQGNNGHAWPGIRTIARDCGISINATIRAIGGLEAAALLEVDRPPADHPRQGNRYRVQNGSAAETEALPKRKRSASETDTKSAAETDAHSDSSTDPLTRPKARAAKKPKPAPAETAWSAALTAMTGDVLKTERFAASWAEWCEYRRQARKPITPATVKRQSHQLEGFGHELAIQSIERSITAGWSGLFRPDQPGGGPGRGSNPARVRRDDDPYSARSKFFDNSPPAT